MNYGRLDHRLGAYCEKEKIMGMLRITHRDKVLYDRSFGYSNVEEKRPFTKDTRFNFYSLSKPFCAIGLLLLKDKGLVDLDTHPGAYVAEARGCDARVTLRHMLHHISGLPDFYDHPELVEKLGHGYSFEIREQLKYLWEYENDYVPGTSGNYNSFNFTLLALVIENVTGEKYADYMRDKVFAPLNMKSALIDNESLTVQNRATGYDLVGDRLVAVDRNLNWMLGGGDAVGTVDDVYALNVAIKNKLLLSAETWREVLTPSDIHCFGMGCMSFDWHGKTRINHNGGSVGFRTLHFQIPEDDFDVIFLSNSGYGNARNDLSEIIYEEFYGADGTVAKDVEMDSGYIPKIKSR